MLNNLLTALVSSYDAAVMPSQLVLSILKYNTLNPNLNSCLCKWLLGADHMVYPESEP